MAVRLKLRPVAAERFGPCSHLGFKRRSSSRRGGKGAPSGRILKTHTHDGGVYCCGGEECACGKGKGAGEARARRGAAAAGRGSTVSMDSACPSPTRVHRGVFRLDALEDSASRLETESPFFFLFPQQIFCRINKLLT
jgi:hypothetical protein